MKGQRSTDKFSKRRIVETSQRVRNLHLAKATVFNVNKEEMQIVIMALNVLFKSQLPHEAKGITIDVCVKRHIVETFQIIRYFPLAKQLVLVKKKCRSSLLLENFCRNLICHEAKDNILTDTSAKRHVAKICKNRSSFAKNNTTGCVGVYYLMIINCPSSY